MKNVREYFQVCFDAEKPKFLRVMRAVPADQATYRPHARSTSAADLVWLDLKGRLAKLLLQLASPADGQAPPVVAPITQADLASLCGVTRESISKTLASFGRRGLVRRDGHGYALLDTATLERLAGG